MIEDRCRIETLRNPSIPHALSGNPDEPEMAPPILAGEFRLPAGQALAANAQSMCEKIPALSLRKRAAHR